MTEFSGSPSSGPSSPHKLLELKQWSPDPGGMPLISDPGETDPYAGWEDADVYEQLRLSIESRLGLGPSDDDSRTLGSRRAALNLPHGKLQTTEQTYLDTAQERHRLWCSTALRGKHRPNDEPRSSEHQEQLILERAARYQRKVISDRLSAWQGWTAERLLTQPGQPYAYGQAAALIVKDLVSAGYNEFTEARLAGRLGYEFRFRDPGLALSVIRVLSRAGTLIVANETLQGERRYRLSARAGD